MKPLTVAALAALAWLLAALPATAEVRTFRSDVGMVFTYDVPDGWLTEPDSHDTLLLKAPDHSAAITLSALVGDRSLDQIAAMMAQAVDAGAPQKGDAAAISGFQGFVYRASGSNSKGVHIDLKLTIVRLDANDAAMTVSMTQSDLSPAQQAVIDSIMTSVTVAPANQK